MTDWTVDLFFSRSSPELGQLGHPPPLDPELAEVSAGGTPAEEKARLSLARPEA